MEIIKNLVSEFKVSIVTVLVVALVCSMFVNFVYYKGMTFNIDKKQIQNNDQRQWQQQFQGQLLINQWNAQGNKIEWNIIIVQSKNYFINNNEIQKQLNTLHPISSFYSKIILKANNDVMIIYPYFFTEKMVKLNKSSVKK